MMQRIRIRNLACALGFACATAFTGSAVQAENTLTLSDQSANPNSFGNVMVASITNDDPIHAISIALSYNAAEFDLTGVDVSGTAVEAISPGGTPEFLAINISYDTGVQVGEVSVGMIFELMPNAQAGIAELAASPMTEQSVANFNFDIPAIARPGDYAMEFVDGLGEPAADNYFSSESTTIIPSLTGGAFTIENPNLFSIPNQTLVPGATSTVAMSITGDYQIQGFQCLISYERNILTFSGATAEGTQASLVLSSQNVDFFTCSLFDGEPYETVESAHFTDATIGPDPLPPGRNVFVYSAIFEFGTTCGAMGTIIDGAFLNIGGGTTIALHMDFLVNPATPDMTETEIEFLPSFRESPQGPLLTNFVTIDGFSVTPETENTVFTVVVNPGFRFIRGDVNTDGVVNLADMISTLGYLFSGNSLTCIEAANSNDDAQINVADVIYLALFLFQGGLPPALPTYPNCGPDTTPTAGLDCLLHAACP